MMSLAVLAISEMRLASTVQSNIGAGQWGREGRNSLQRVTRAYETRNILLRLFDRSLHTSIND